MWLKNGVSSHSYIGHCFVGNPEDSFFWVEAQIKKLLCINFSLFLVLYEMLCCSQCIKLSLCMKIVISLTGPIKHMRTGGQ